MNFRKHPVIFIGFAFALLSLIFNIVWILLFHMAHVYDIVHVFPVILIYEPIINAIGGYVTTEFIFLPLAILIDFIIGLLVGLFAKRFVKTNFIIILIISFAVYWIVITYQWLPII